MTLVTSFYRTQERSVVLQLVVFLDEILNRLDNKEGEEILALYINFRKAFDKLTHQKHISKQGDMGIVEILLKLLASYLTDRQQRVKFGQQKFETSKVTRGVPQGSIPGEMFIVHINTLTDSVQKSPAYGYADDFKIITSSLQETDQATNSVQLWSNENDMILNRNKSKILSISGETTTNEENQSLEIVKNRKDLGVIMSSNLSWSENCRQRVSKRWRSFYALKKNILPIANLPTKLYVFIGYS